jgi:hypothetical protein
VILTARAAAVQPEFQSIDRTDTVYFGGVGARYLLTENLELDADWRFLNRNSDDKIVEFDTNRVSLSLTGKF